MISKLDKLKVAHAFKTIPEEELLALWGEKGLFVAKHRFNKNYLLTQREVAAKLGCSHARVGQIESRVVYKFNRTYEHWTKGLSHRSSQALINVGCESKEDVAELYRSGQMLNLKNLGVKSVAEIKRWLGEDAIFDIEDAISRLEQLGYTVTKN